MQKNTPHLSERNLQTIYTVGRCKFLSSHQLKREFYPNTTHETATQRLTAEIPNKDMKVKVRDKRTRTTDGTPKEFIVDRHFNPDSLALLREPGNEFTFNVVEIDNNSNNPADMRAKYEAFIGYDNQSR